MLTLNYNREVKRLKVNVRKVHNRSKYRQNYQAELKRLSKVLLLAKKKAQETFLRSVISMLKGVEEIEKTFRRSKTVMTSSSQNH
jgi:hypothetical protein